MCPACLAAAALITGSALSAGALTAIVVNEFWAENICAKYCESVFECDDDSSHTGS